MATDDVKSKSFIELAMGVNLVKLFRVKFTLRQKFDLKLQFKIWSRVKFTPHELYELDVFLLRATCYHSSVFFAAVIN